MTLIKKVMAKLDKKTNIIDQFQRALGKKYNVSGDGSTLFIRDKKGKGNVAEITIDVDEELVSGYFDILDDDGGCLKSC